MAEVKKVRPQYTAERKVALVDEADQSVAVVARTHDVSPSVVFPVASARPSCRRRK
jgi:transposase-like protein